MYYTPPKKKKFKPRLRYIALLLVVFLFLWSFLKSSPATKTTETLTQKIERPVETIEPKVDNEVNPRSSNIHITLKSEKNDSLSVLFQKAALSNKVLLTLLNQIKHAKQLEKIKENQYFYFILNKDKKLIQLTSHYEDNKKLIIKKRNNAYESNIITLTPETERHYITASIDESLYTTGLKQKIPHKLLIQLTKIFARSINFSKDVRNNDRFTIIYQTNTLKNQASTIGKILAARYTSKNKTHTAINFQAFNKEDDYFTPGGQSLKLSFDRYPIAFTHISSNFNPYRMHPILKVNRPHRGIDLAAKQGTPIHAVADGKITQIGPNSGYGNAIKINHSKKYETVYAHMFKFKNGLTKGKRVKRGEVIGFVGQTGLATAPHCHFEFRVFGKHVDPAIIDLPTAPNLENKTLQAFKKKTKDLLEQLSLYENASQASNS